MLAYVLSDSYIYTLYTACLQPVLQQFLQQTHLGATNSKQKNKSFYQLVSYLIYTTISPVIIKFASTNYWISKIIAGERKGQSDGDHSLPLLSTQ